MRDIPPQTLGVSTADSDAIVAAYASGESTDSIAARFGLTATMVEALVARETAATVETIPGRGSAPAASWYADPGSASAQRWWDGQQWTDFVQPTPAVHPVAPTVQFSLADGPSRPVPAVEALVAEAGYHRVPQPGYHVEAAPLVATVHSPVAPPADTNTPSAIDMHLSGEICLNGHQIPRGAIFCPLCGAKMGLDRNQTAPRQDGKKHGFRRLSGLEIGLASTVTLALAAGLVAWISHGVSAPAAAETTTVTGNLSLFDFETRLDGCVTGGGYSDITPGAQVVITNQAGTIVGSGGLGDPTPILTGTCSFPFSISGVPANEQQYAIEVSHRGKTVYSNAELTANNWSADLSLGHGD